MILISRTYDIIYDIMKCKVPDVCRTANVTSPAAATSISATTWLLLLLALIVGLGMAGGSIHKCKCRGRNITQIS
jgi:hypothetical protein